MFASMAAATPIAPLNCVLEWLDGLAEPKESNFKDDWIYRFAQNIKKENPLKIRLIDAVDDKKSQNYTYDKKNKLLLPYTGDVGYGDLSVSVSSSSGLWRVNLGKHSYRFYADLKLENEKFSIIQTTITLVD